VAINNHSSAAAVTRVIAFSGHMIDAPGRATPRFPAYLERAVKAALDQALVALVPAEGFTQAACGADLLFCESMLGCGQEINIVLPFALDDFIQQSVALAGPGWVGRFEHHDVCAGWPLRRRPEHV
jgi:hypothetical protein